METTPAIDRLNFARQFRWLAEVHAYPLPAQALPQLLGEQSDDGEPQRPPSSNWNLPGSLLGEPIFAGDVVCDAVAKVFCPRFPASKNWSTNSKGSKTDANLTFAMITEHLKNVDQIKFYRHGPYTSPYIAACWLLADALECEHAAAFGNGDGREGGNGSASSSDMPTLTDNETIVFSYLHRVQPKLCTLDAIVAGTEVSRATVSKAVIKLINTGLAHRPEGDRQGATLTDRGRAAAALLIR